MEFDRRMRLGEKDWLARAFGRSCTESAMGTRSQEFSDYLGPSFSSILGPCSCHSCLVIHMFSLSAIYRLSAAESDYTLGNSRLTHNVCKHCATKEDHMSPPWWILDSDLEFLGVRVSIVLMCVALETHIQPLRVPTQDFGQPQLLDLLLHPRWQPWVHAATTTKYDSLIQARPDIHICRLYCIEQELRNARLFDVHKMRLK